VEDWVEARNQRVERVEPSSSLTNAVSATLVAVALLVDLEQAAERCWR